MKLAGNCHFALFSFLSDSFWRHEPLRGILIWKTFPNWLDFGLGKRKRPEKLDSVAIRKLEFPTNHVGDDGAVDIGYNGNMIQCPAGGGKCFCAVCGRVGSNSIGPRGDRANGINSVLQAPRAASIPPGGFHVGPTPSALSLGSSASRAQSGLGASPSGAGLASSVPVAVGGSRAGAANQLR